MNAFMRARSLAFAAALGALAAFAGLLSAAPAPRDAAAPPAPEATAASQDPFLAEAGPLLSGEELAIYRALDKPYQRDAFAKRFWAVRDPYPQTAANELRDRWSERMTAARQRFATLDDARATALLFAGEPQATLRMACPELLATGEIWVYPAAERVAEPFALVFLPAGRADLHRFWKPSEGLGWLANGRFESDEALLAAVSERCARGRDVAAALVLARGWDDLDARWHLVPRPGSEWARGFLPLAGTAPPGTPELAAELAIAFPGRNQSRTRVEGTFRLAAPAAGAPRAYAIDGEVVRGDELFETFRYRFDPPASAIGEDGALALVFERSLRPGRYTLVVRLADLGGGGETRRELELDVPVVLAAAVAETAAAAPPAPPATAPAAAEVGGATEAAAEEEASLRLLAPLDRLVTGRARVEADVRGDVDRVAFLLDDKPILEKRRPPYTVELDFGPAPRPRRVTGIAYAEDGSEVARDEAMINGGPHRFAVRLLGASRLPEPAGGPERLRVEVEVEIPEGETLDRLELFVDDERVATLFQPPWAQSVAIPPGAAAAWVRGVAYLAGGGAAEDVRLLGGAGAGASVDVDLVELYTSVLDRKGHPVEDLEVSEVRVAEDGERQEIRRFERVADRPMHAAVMLDLSGSMVEELHDLERAALGFFERVLTPRDRAAVISFADQVRLAARFTAQQEVLAGALAGLEARGDTRLYDAVAFALHYFSGIRGQRALVLISDGFDSGSRYGFPEVLDYARRTGVAIYAIGLGVPTNPPEGRLVLDQLARETGGRSFYVQRAAELERIYRTIEREIRAQWLIAYQSPKSEGNAFRTVEVRVDRPGVEARTIRGYYP